MRIFLLVSLLVLCTQAAQIDQTWKGFLTNLFDNDKNAPKVLSINEWENKKGFIKSLSSKVNEPAYHTFQQFVESRNFGKYFDYLKRTEMYKLMQRSIATEFNIPAESQDKLIFIMWEEYFRNSTNELPNWYNFYLLQEQGRLRMERVVDQRGVFAAWFKDENGQTIKRTFFTGTSPDFDFIAFTLCALQTTRERQSLKCSFELNENPVTAVVVARRIRDELKIIRVEPRQANFLRTVPSNQRKHRKPNTTDTGFQDFVDSLWAADEDRAPPGYIELNWQEKLSKGGRPLKPLFNYVNETLFERPIYKAQIDMYKKNLFVPSVCTDEKALQGDKLDTLKQFFDLLTSSKCFNLAYDYLKKNGHATQDYDKFLKTIFVLWFNTYTRCRGPKGSSGFEHVYLGEQKQSSVDGQHNWVRYYLLEKDNKISYYGYYVHDADFIGTFKYKWGTTLKEKGGFFISTSPAFDFSMFTVCVLAQSGNEHCRFKINDMPLFITSYQQQCDGGSCLSTSYPGIVE